MNNRIFFKIPLLLLSLFTFLECTEVLNKTTNSNLLEKKLNNKNKKKLKVTSKKSFSSNESLKFSVDTGTKEGFIYLVYVDKSGETILLYPNDKSNQKKKRGKLKFPEDFGGADIKTTKDCKNCEKEKTTIVVLLSDDPIENIQNMNEEELISINTQTRYKSRNFLISEPKPHILVHKFNFFVE